MNILDKFRLNGKKSFVTGGAGGIGRATAKAFAEAGADVAIVDIPAKYEELRDIANEMSKNYGVTVVPVKADVSDPASVDEMIGNILSEFGTIDVVHSNAGVLTGGDPDIDVSYEEWRRNIDINLCGMFLVGRASARVMKKEKKGGSIINTASMSGMIINEVFNDVSRGSAYATAKAGVIQLTKSQAAQWVKYNIRVNAISPGYVASGMHNGIVPNERLEWCAQRVPMKRFGTVEEMEGLVLYLASDSSSYVTGANMVVDGGYTIW